MTPLIERPYPIGSRVWWNYPNDDIAPCEVVVLEVPPYCRHYSYVLVEYAPGKKGHAIYSELKPLKK